MFKPIDDIEQRRVALQADLDAKKTQVERNRLGQFATPTALAWEILEYASRLIPDNEVVNFLDPAIGTGSFYSALLKVFPENRIEKALGFEIDPHYGKPSMLLWKDAYLTLKSADFTHEEPSGRFNLIICNPPYVRHHHLQNGNKFRLQSRTCNASGMKLSGLAGLYCHFLGLAHAWMADGGVAGWLIPSEFMDVNYGLAVKLYLLERVTLLRIHRFDPNDVQFADALVSSAIVWFRNTPPPVDHRVLFTMGGTLLEPVVSRSISAGELGVELKWTRFPAADVRIRTTTPKLSAFFQIKRGIATGDNKFFIFSEEDVKTHALPIQELRHIAQPSLSARGRGEGRQGRKSDNRATSLSP
jgi:adenine-specific DNA-methyltransferase